MRVALHPEVILTVKVNVARSPEEAEIQARGGTILAAGEDDDEAMTAEDDFDDRTQAAAPALPEDSAAGAEEAADAPETAVAGEEDSRV